LATPITLACQCRHPTTRLPRSFGVVDAYNPVTLRPRYGVSTGWPQLDYPAAAQHPTRYNPVTLWLYSTHTSQTNYPAASACSSTNRLPCAHSPVTPRRPQDSHKTAPHPAYPATSLEGWHASPRPVAVVDKPQQPTNRLPYEPDLAAHKPVTLQIELHPKTRPSYPAATALHSLPTLWPVPASYLTPALSTPLLRTGHCCTLQPRSTVYHAADL
jgi:hypothetical protein